MKFPLLYLISLFLFTGCTIIPNQKTTQEKLWPEHQTDLQQLTYWSFSGKLAVITPDERNSVNIHWQQDAQNFHIQLTTFLGLSVLEVKKTESGTFITDSDGNQYQSQDTDTLITDLSGMQLPVNSLQQWIKGDPENSNYQLNEQQQVKSLVSVEGNDTNWSINYHDYRAINGTYLPHKLSLHSGDIRLKIAISNWTVNTQAN